MIMLGITVSLILLISGHIYADNNKINVNVRQVNDDSSSIFIPVAVISDETRQAKAIDSTVSKSININPSEKTSIENKDQKVFKLSKNFAVNPNRNKEKHLGVDQPLKVDINTDLQIPVAVVYEEPTTPNNVRKVTLRRKVTTKEQSLNRRRTENVTTIPNKPISTETRYKPENATLKPQLKTTEPTSTTPNSLKDSENNSTKKRTRERDPVVPIIQSENQVFSHNGVFHYSYEGGDGTKAFEKGELKTYDDEKTGEAVVGGFSYKDKDGQDYSLSYTADENGYRPVGAHLPTPPPIPPAIARALKYLATKTTPEPVTDSI
ncbi:uncharacterized protein LOC131853116 [Achroia grisella]|uniref:uncharacterized protein LOC131853116 n=1 Tax=Achroia grisella TaxID=688607 RepID=UPI0027D2FB06|nr:uncharacterized protein LOC131853116 [Achroia grisella]